MRTAGVPSGVSFTPPHSLPSLTSLAERRWLNVALFGALIVAMLVFLPETKVHIEDTRFITRS